MCKSSPNWFKGDHSITKNKSHGEVWSTECIAELRTKSAFSNTFHYRLWDICLTVAAANSSSTCLDQTKIQSSSLRRFRSERQHSSSTMPPAYIRERIRLCGLVDQK
ncbi:hypothetical protein TNCT_641761 [Trichonephila clavata]|uniref:Uncharacterized protein n=1 Tax=Trichonephila clavata TaxID=2740835 RepID=A0A8X6GXD6_TRICU|nr:hypothetical protein TNCT_641761 [Trichonephila clavata]